VRARASLRAGDLRAGREPGQRPPHPRLPGDAAACQLAGIAVSAGWMAGHPRPGRRAGGSQRVHRPGPGAAAGRGGGARDETPARAAGGTRVLHLACTRYLTCMHTGDRSAEAIDAGGVLPGYDGVIVRDG